MKAMSDIRKIELNIRKINRSLNFANFANVNLPLPLQKRKIVTAKNKMADPETRQKMSMKSQIDIRNIRKIARNLNSANFANVKQGIVLIFTSTQRRPTPEYRRSFKTRGRIDIRNIRKIQMDTKMDNQTGLKCTNT